ncbi:MAG: serine/threonine protein kinase [Xanthomonadales bacterium]|nr:serine/threonine protein kinase [Xanthomonadales bacterium]
MNDARSGSRGYCAPGEGLDWDRVWTVFHDALDRPRPGRVEWVRGVLSDPASARVLDEVLCMLGAHEQGDSPLDRPALSLLQHSAPPVIPGAWNVTRRLGDGGMAEVHLAARSDGDYEQLAAVKLIDVMPGDEQAFAAERRALAKLRHPHIAQLYDSGICDDGRPFLVMEYVEGRRLDDWIAERNPSIGERLALFVLVCRAVHHAHRSLIVHRDLKPSNVLVTRDEAPKLIDFGIAGAPGDGVARLTPAFASPEQLRGEAVTTASDVFALGVLLHWLLTGAPMSGGTEATVEQRLARIDAGVQSLPRRKAGPLAPLGRFRRSELNAILSKALQPEPELRYASAAALAAEVERWLQRRPLIACGEGVGYRMRSAIARHPAPFAVIGVALMALLASIVLLALQGRQLRDALALAQAQTQRAEQAAGFLAALFTDTDPEQQSGRSVSAADLLRKGAARLEGIDDPALREQLQLVVADALLHTGELQDAETLFQALRTHPAAQARALEGLATVAQEQGKHAQAEQLQRAALASLQASAGSPSVPGDAVAWRAHLKLAAILQSLGRLDSAAVELEGVSTQQAAPELAADADIRLGALAWGRGELPTAERYYRQALDRYEDAFEAPHHQIARAHYAIGTALHRQGRHAGARMEYAKALQQRQAVYGERHPRVAETLEAMAALAYDAGDADRAIDLGRRALDMKRELLGGDSPTLGLSHTNLALALHETGRFDEAEAHYRQALSLNQRAFDSGHPGIVGSLGNLALLALDRGRHDDARHWLDRARPLADALPDGHRIRAYINHLDGRALLEVGRPAQALQWLESALAARRAQGDGRHPYVADSHYWLAWQGLEVDDLARAITHAQAALELRAALLDGDDWRVTQSRVQLAALRWLASRRSRHDGVSEEALAAELDALSRRRDSEDWRVLALLQRLRRHGMPVQ